MSLSAAKSRVMQAKMSIESRKFDDVEPTLQAAEGFLRELGDDEKAPVLAEIKDIRAQLAGRMSPEDERALSQANGKVKLARSQLDSKQPLAVEETLEEAERLLANLADAHRAELFVEIRAIRDVMSRADAIEAAARAQTAALADEAASKVSRAKDRLKEAHGHLESGRTEDIEGALAAAEGFLEGLPDPTRAPLVADIAAARLKLASARAAEDARRLGSQIDRHLRSADGSIDAHPHVSAAEVKLVLERLDADDVKQTLSSEAINAYRARVVGIETRLAARNKVEALEEALPVLRSLEERVAGLPHGTADVATSDLQTLKDRVLDAIHALPDSDPDVMAINARLAVTDQKIDASARGK